jgi:hypothetical protein
LNIDNYVDFLSEKSNYLYEIIITNKNPDFIKFDREFDKAIKSYIKSIGDEGMPSVQVDLVAGVLEKILKMCLNSKEQIEHLVLKVPFKELEEILGEILLDYKKNNPRSLRSRKAALVYSLKQIVKDVNNDYSNIDLDRALEVLEMVEKLMDVNEDLEEGVGLKERLQFEIDKYQGKHLERIIEMAIKNTDNSFIKNILNELAFSTPKLRYDTRQEINNRENDTKKSNFDSHRQSI